MRGPHDVADVVRVFPAAGRLSGSRMASLPTQILQFYGTPYDMLAGNVLRGRGQVGWRRQRQVDGRRVEGRARWERCKQTNNKQLAGAVGERCTMADLEGAGEA